MSVHSKNFPRLRAAGTSALLGLGLATLLAGCGGGGGAPTAPPGSPQVSLSAAPSTVAAGGTTTLTWSATGATACTASGGWSGTLDVSGSQASPALSRATTFTLLCTGAGGSGTATTRVDVTQGGAVVQTSTSATLAAGAATVTDGDTTVDFSAEPALAGRIATAQHISAPAIDTSAAGAAPALSADLSTPTTLRTFLPVPPAGDDVLVSVSTSATYAGLPADQAPVLYMLVRAADTGDAADTFLPLESTYNEKSGLLSAVLPANAFLADAELGAVATLKIGVATLQASPGANATSATNHRRFLRAVGKGAGGAPDGMVLPCPIAGTCTESSLFDAIRNLGAGPQRHVGIDLAAATPTDVVPPAGGVVVGGETRASHDAESGTPECATGAGAGVNATLRFDAQHFALRFMHLSQFAVGATAPVTSADATSFNPSYTSDGTTAMGQTGQTGHATTCAGTANPHLHVELYVPLAPQHVTRKGGVSEQVLYAPTAVDPFPYFVNAFTLATPADPVLANGKHFPLVVTATDPNGKLVTSAVPAAHEFGDPSGLFDPARKLCFLPAPSNTVLVTATPALAAPLGHDGSICGAWSASFDALGLAGAPATTITARYSLQPELPLAQDPLSGAYSPIQLTAGTFGWTWLGGASQAGAGLPGVYGTMGVPAAGNTPGGRDMGASWTDATGRLWLFGGQGYDSQSNVALLGDLWMLDPATRLWTWEAGGNLANTPGVYGTQGVPATTNLPGARVAAGTWQGHDGRLWLLGGQGVDGAGNQSTLNDLWVFDPAAGTWTWVTGDATVAAPFGAPAVYGTQGVAAAGNTPGGRAGAATWVDAAGHLWLMGGDGVDSIGMFGTLNDLWMFDPATSQWTWVGGANVTEAAGVYGTLGAGDATTVPGARADAAAWVDGFGDLWLFGGFGHDNSSATWYLNDVWKYSIAGHTWSWMGGSSTGATSPVSGTYGTQGLPGAGNTPGGRAFSAHWTDLMGNFWLFGGTGVDATPDSLATFNDLWRYSPTTRQWTWMGGPNAGNGTASYGTMGVPSPSNLPGPRWAPATWRAADGSLWMLGGFGADAVGQYDDLNDVWQYMP